MKHDYTHVVAALFGEVWALPEQKLVAIADVVQAHIESRGLTGGDLRARLGRDPEPRPKRRQMQTVAVLAVHGVIAPRMNLMTQMSGGTSIDLLTAEVREAIADPAVGAVILDIDSPGGAVHGIDELAAELRVARSRKPIIASVNHTAASAAYWLAANCSEIVAPPSADVGSIGVLALHEDVSKALETAGVKMTIIKAGRYKDENNPFEPMTADGRGALQARVNEAYEAFVAAVAAGRRVPEARVRDGFGQGRIVSAKTGLALGMVDRLETLDTTVTRLATNPYPPAVAATRSAIGDWRREHARARLNL